MTGMHVEKKWITCARVNGASIQRVLDSETQREGMHACPPGSPMSGLDVRGNYLICGTHGTPLSRPRIDRLEPAEPVVGETFDIHGYNFGGPDAQRTWAVHLYQPIRSGDLMTYELEIVDWVRERIRVKLPADIPGSNELPSGSPYRLRIEIRGRDRAISSNQATPTIHTRSAEIYRPGEPWIRGIYRDRSREQLWIYGYFPPPATRGTGTDGIELLMKEAAGPARTPMGIFEWRRERMIARPQVPCNAGTYLVQFRIIRNPVRRSNEVPVTLGQAWCSDPNMAERRFMHIDGVEFEASPYVADERPESPRPGDWLDIFGTGFNAEGGPERSVHRGSRVVELWRIVNGRTHVTEAPILYVARDVDGRGGPPRVHWSDFHIAVEIPRDVEPGDYSVHIVDKRANRASNNVRIRILPRE